MNTILHKELSYKLNGLFFKIHNTLGRFCREKQYADALEKLLIQRVINTDANLRIDTNDTNKSRFKNSQHSYVPQLRDSYHSHRYAGFGIVEIIIAMAIFIMMAATAGTVVVHTFSSGRLGNEESDAAFQAQEGIEAVRSIRNQGWCTPFLATDCSVSCGISNASNVWAFAGSNNVNGKFTRTIKVELVNRDAGGTIVTSGGINDPNTKKITSTVTWDFNSARPENVTFTTYLTNFRKSVASSVHGGMLVYGNGGTGSDAMAYRKLNGSTGIWEDSTPMPDFDGDTIETRAVRAVRLDSSPTRNEKIALVRRYSASNPVRREHSIWAYVWDGNSWMSTGSPFAAWTSTSYLDVRNFDGAYLSNGNYMFVYSNNTSTPKYRIWDGCSWSGENSLVNLADNGSGIPLYIVTKARPGTNEVMAAFFGVARDTNTQYYKNNLWNLYSPSHSTVGPASKEMIDFAWSPQDSTQGALVFPDAVSGAESRDISLRIFTADSSQEGGTWSNIVESASTGSTIGAMDIDGRKGAEEFLSCTKQGGNDIYCFRANTTPAWASSPSNNNLTGSGATDNGIQRSFNIAYETTGGTLAVVVYSDTTAIPKLKTYNPSMNQFIAAPTSLPSVSTALESVRLRAFQDNDDIMILLANTSNRLYSVVWDGSANAVYTTPSGKAFTQHQSTTNGSADEDFFYDFAWDRF